MNKKFYEATVNINSTPENIWKILTDAPGYSQWDNGVERVEGKISPGKTIKVYAKVSPGRAFPVKVTELCPDSKMVWSGGMPFGLFKGVRIFTLSTQVNGTITFKMREEFSGPMLSMIWSSMPDLGPSFEQFARGLKARAES